MSALQPFDPQYGSGQPLTATASSQYALFSGTNKQVVVTNLGTNVAYVKVTNDTTKAASTADMPVIPGAQITLTKGDDDLAIAYISAAGTSLHVITGEGW
jgi:hypothetical protein